MSNISIQAGLSLSERELLLAAFLAALTHLVRR